MSALTPQKSTTLGDYGFALNPPPPQGSQHNRGISFGSSPPMRSKEWTHQVQGPNNYGSPASSQPAVTSTSVMRDVIPMTANSYVVPRKSGSPLSRNAVLHSSTYNSPTPHDIGDTRTSSHPATGRAYLSPHAFSMPGPISHTLYMSWHHGTGMTTSDMHSAAPVMANPNAWTPDNLEIAVAHNLSQSVPYRHDLRDARSCAGMNNAPHDTFQMPDPIDHASPMSWHHGMTASDGHSVVPMMANRNAWTLDNLGTAVVHNLSQSVPYVHDPGVVNPSSQLPPAWQSELPINRPPPLHCEWVDNNIRCRYEGTLEGLKRHWRDRHLPARRRARAIQCKWENCNYERGGTRLMCRSSMWRHISEVHLMLPRH